MTNDVIVIGGGPAGMTAAFTAAQNGRSVLLLEKNEKLGKKLFISGKGRCNITNACDTEDFFANIIRNPKFLMSALYSFPNTELIKLLESEGLKTKTERGGRIFPVSDKSSDVISCLKRLLDKSGARYLLNTKVSEIRKSSELFSVITPKVTYTSRALIIATGGVSYPLTGSTGDGYEFARSLSHTVTDIKPSLVPLVEDGDICAKMQGLTLKNVIFTLYEGGKKVYSDMGELLFTHFGLSGPLALSAGSRLSYKTSELSCTIDLKPALSEEKLNERLLRDFAENKNKQTANALSGLLPSSMILPFIEYCGIDPQKEINSVTKAERAAIIDALKRFAIKLKGTRPIDEAIITRGGIKVSEINPSTMESKKVPRLYFAGEVIDVDALTGGFNLQIAFSTGRLAGAFA